MWVWIYTPLPGRAAVSQHDDYHLPEGRLEGFWIRLRYVFLDIDIDIDIDASSAHVFRAILNYEIPIL